MSHQPDRDRNWQRLAVSHSQARSLVDRTRGRETRPLRTSEADRLGTYVDVPDRRDVHAIHMRTDEALSLVAKLPPHERADGAAVARAHDQVAFPVPELDTVFDLCRALVDHRHRGQSPASVQASQ